MKIKSLLSAVLIVTISLSSCKSGSTGNKSGGQNRSVASDIKTSDTMSSDFDQIIDSLTINGADIKFPVTIDSLGEGYSYDKSSLISGGDMAFCNLMYNNKMIGSCQLAQCGDDKYTDKPMSMLCILNTGKKKDDPSYTEASISDISMDSKLEDVTASFGDPQFAAYNSDTKNYELQYIKDDENKIEIYVDDSVNKIAIYYQHEK
ncbi:MAG: hypothetical protein Q4F95_11315 [Oscillospiraceae bacterium]|nr:hypothetical protein [Oscillospiraceae bacterium]